MTGACACRPSGLRERTFSASSRQDEEVLEPFGTDLWVAHAPLTLLGVPAGRWMAVARLAGGALWVHSPAPLDDALRRALKELGEVRWVVAASRLHGHVWMEQYRPAFPPAELLAPPGLAKRRKDLRFDGDLPGAQWEGVIDQELLRGHRLLDEVEFFHRPSRTAVMGDAVWNVAPSDPGRVRLWAGRRSGPGPTRVFRWQFRDRAAARASIDRMLAWDPERLACGHGAPIASGGGAALAEAYAWLPATGAR